MSFSNAFNYLVFDNPISKGVVELSKSIAKPLIHGTNPPNITEQIKLIKINEMVDPLWKMALKEGPFIRIAGISGAAAVALGAYGAHKEYPKDKIEKLKPIFENANKFHFLTSLALLGVPFCRRPTVSASLLITGTLLFSGTCYYHAITGENKFGRLAPVGGTILILGWLSMAL